MTALMADAAADDATADPTFVCTAFKKKRFYLFSRREPDETPTAADGAEGDEWVRFAAVPRIGVMVHALREKLDELFPAALLAHISQWEGVPLHVAGATARAPIAQGVA